MSTSSPRVAAIIPARDEAERIGATIAAVQQIAGVDLVVVVDDGSEDDTHTIAAAAGAIVVRHDRNRGKAAAVTSGARRVAQDDLAERPAHPHLLLLVDADLGQSAGNLAVLVPPVVLGECDLTIATLPPQTGLAGGRGRVVKIARDGILHLTGQRMVQPLSGQRCISRAAFDAATPLAKGWGIEVGMTIDVLRAGYSVREIPCDLQHRVTGSDFRSTMHRAAQMRDVVRALTRRGAPGLPVEIAAAGKGAAARLWSKRPGQAERR